jgi:hypothetical protein
VDSPVIVRHKWTFPALILAPSERQRPIVTHDHGFAWTFDATFWEDVYSLSLFADASFSSGDAGTVGDAFGSGIFGGSDAPTSSISYSYSATIK